MSASDSLKLLQRRGETGPEYLKWVSDFVQQNKHKTSLLKNPAGAVWKILGLTDTIYWYEPGRVDDWESCYLPYKVSMEVIGVVMGTSYQCDQLVLMTCEDEKIYAYDREESELHVVASSIEQLCADGLEHPPFKSYCYGEPWNDMNMDDWNLLKKAERLYKWIHQIQAKNRHLSKLIGQLMMYQHCVKR